MILIYRFSETIPIVIGKFLLLKVSSSYKLHAATFSSPLPLSIPISPSPQVPLTTSRKLVSRHTGYPGGFPFGCWRGMIMEDDHDLDLQIFRNNPNCNWEVSSSYKLHAATFSSPLPLSIPISPSPKSQVQEAGKPWLPWCRALVPAGAALAARSPLLYATPQGHQAVRCAPQCC